MRRKQAGLTLTELWVILCIFAVLAAILLPVFQKAASEGKDISNPVKILANNTAEQGERQEKAKSFLTDVEAAMVKHGFRIAGDRDGELYAEPINPGEKVSITVYVYPAGKANTTWFEAETTREESK